MQSQKPAEGVMLKKQFPNAEWYEVACDCGENTHNHNVWIESDPETNSIAVYIYTESSTDFWTQTLDEHKDFDNSFINTVWRNTTYVINETVRRTRLVMRVLIRGSVSQETTTILSKQQALNYSKLLQESMSRIDRK